MCIVAVTRRMLRRICDRRERLAVAVTFLCMIQWCSGQSTTIIATSLIIPRETPPGGCEMDQGLTDLRVQLEYREIRLDGDIGDWKLGGFRRLESLGMFRDVIVLNSSTVDGLQIRFLQLEHGGGLCNCWFVGALSVTVNETTTEPE